MANKKAKEETMPIKFTKQQLLKSKAYSHRRDALNALLRDDETYSFNEVDKILDNFYKGGHK